MADELADPSTQAHSFVTLFDEFLDSCKARWPSDLELSKCSLKLKSVVLGTEANERQFVDKFFATLMATTPAQVKVPYRKAFVDLAGNDITNLVLAHYKDYDRLFEACDAMQIEHVNFELHDKYTTADPGTRKVMITVIANLVAIATANREIPEYPSKAEVTARVQERKKAKADRKLAEVNGNDAEIAMVSNAISSLADVLGDEKVEPYANLSPENKVRAREAWGPIARGEATSAIEGKSISKLYAACNFDFLDALGLQTMDGSKEDFAPFWDHLKRTAGFGAVRSSIPSNIMTSIEAQAREVVSAMQRGEVSLETLDISKIGEAVLETCSAEDMSALAGNMPSMIPQLAQLSGDIPGGEALRGLL